MTERRSGPDFLCIGLQRAGTRWLYEQLRGHPDYWMPPIKELHFFDGNFDKRDRIQLTRLIKDTIKRGTITKDDVNDFRFYCRFISTYDRNTIDMDWYEGLLNLKGDRLTGDITPGYSRLSVPTIMQIKKKFPRLRIVLLLRDPVERLWSHLCMQWRRGAFPSETLESFDLIRGRILKHTYLTNSYPSKIWLDWSSVFDLNNLGYWFLEDIAQSPHQTIVEISRFIGGSPSVGKSNPTVNTKSVKRKLPMSNEIRKALASIFFDEIELCANIFGSHAITWKERYASILKHSQIGLLIWFFPPSVV